MAEAELFVGFENGAIGLFRISLGPSVSEGVPGPIKTFKMFTAQKLIQDPNMRHILSIGVAHTNPTQDVDFTISIGYYSKLIQTIKFTAGLQDNNYTMVDQTVTEGAFHDKPGIGCQHTLRVG